MISKNNARKMIDMASAIFETLAVNEELVGKLYRSFSEKIPEQKDFWEKLSAAEFRHAQWIRGMLNQVKNGTMIYTKSRVKIEAVKSFTAFLNDRIIQANGGEIGPEAAISLAMDIERSLIERKYFEIVEGMTPEMKKVIKALADETERHYSAMQNFANQNRSARIGSH
jgi:rubrerythrin